MPARRLLTPSGPPAEDRPAALAVVWIPVADPDGSRLAAVFAYLSERAAAVSTGPPRPEAA